MTSKLISREGCPQCVKDGRDTSEDNLAIYDDGHRYCFGCGYYEGKNGETELPSYSYEYLSTRGIGKEIFKFYDAKTKIDHDGKPLSIGFVYPNNSVKVRHLDVKDFYTTGDIGKAGLFGRNKFAAGSHNYVTITEGEFDALSLYQVLRSPVVSVQSAGTAVRDCGLDRSWLNSFQRVYLAFDNDEPGREAVRRVARLFDYNKVYHVRFTNRKDANDYVAVGEGDELRNIWWNAKKFLPDEIESDLAVFNRILTEPLKEGISYPFRTLTDMTYGIRTGESVLITAQEGIGKTEIMHTIENHILKEHPDANVGAIFLEEPKRRHLQAIAGIELQKPVHLPDCDCTVLETTSALERVVTRDDRLHIYSHFGSNDPEVLLDTIRFLVSARDCRYILLDHITMAVSGLGGEDERRALDYLSTRLEMMVKELDFALILVSHVNDDGRTRGSRYISKVADIRIDATRDLENVDPMERNRTHLMVSKNRFCGRTGPAGTLVFNPRTYTLTEDLGFPEAANDNQDTPKAMAG